MAPKSSKEFEHISKSFFNFILVRHPFERLISAYKDRIKGCKMKAEWYNSGMFLTSVEFIFIVCWVLVREMLKIRREPNCLADTDIGKIIVTDNRKLTVERKSVVIPTFKY